MDVMKLIDSKNACLERFLTVSVAYWEQTKDGELEGLLEFQRSRDSILKAIDLFDRKIGEAVAETPESARTPYLVEQVKAALDRKESLVRKILEIDLKIIGKIEETKTKLLKDMNNAQKSKEVLSKFKSTWVQESGEEVDRTL